MLTSRSKLKHSALQVIYPFYQYVCLQPTFLIIGAQRAGTASLFYMLHLHPQILPSMAKEIHFFDHWYAKGWAWYRSQYPFRLGSRSYGMSTLPSGEATPYYLYHPLVAQRIAKHMPDVRLIALLRDPIKRAYSHYRREVSKLRETLSFWDALQAEKDRLRGEEERITHESGYRGYNHQRYSYQARGQYVDQVDRYRAHFPAEQLLLVESERLFSDSKTELARIFAFLGVDSIPMDFAHEHRSNPTEPIDPATLDYLRAHFKPYNDRLREKYHIGHSWDY